MQRGDDQIELSTRELTLLKVLMREPGRVFTRTELCERVWEREHEYDMKLVEVFVGRLRKKIGNPPLIQTVRMSAIRCGNRKRNEALASSVEASRIRGGVAVVALSQERPRRGHHALLEAQSLRSAARPRCT